MTPSRTSASHAHPGSRSAARTAGRVLAAGAFAAVGAGVWASGVEPHLFRVRRFALPILPPGHRDIRVLHVSDLHLAAWQRHKMSWVSQLSRLRPDLVINTGDNFSGNVLPDVLATFDSLLDVPGVFVFGSNDLYAPTFKNPARYLLRRQKTHPDHGRPNLPFGQLAAAFNRRGWEQLDNRSAELTIRDTRIAFAGLGDAHIRADRLNPPDFAAGADVRIGVTHAPYTRPLDALVAAGAQALFAGHTHGGQLRIPFWGAPVTNCDLPHDRARGLIDYDGVPLEISAGLGFSVFAPVRFACPPEVSLITLSARG